MTKAELLQQLGLLNELIGKDAEAAASKAYSLLFEYIDDDEIEAAYAAIDSKWQG